MYFGHSYRRQKCASGIHYTIHQIRSDYSELLHEKGPTLPIADNNRDHYNGPMKKSLPPTPPRHINRDRWQDLLGVCPELFADRVKFVKLKRNCERPLLAQTV